MTNFNKKLQLISAAQNGDFDGVKKLIATGVDPKSFECAALCEAIANNHTQIALHFIQLCAPFGDNAKPLRVALTYKNDTIIDALWEQTSLGDNPQSVRFCKDQRQKAMLYKPVLACLFGLWDKADTFLKQAEPTSVAWGEILYALIRLPDNGQDTKKHNLLQQVLRNIDSLEIIDVATSAFKDGFVNSRMCIEDLSLSAKIDDPKAQIALTLLAGGHDFVLKYFVRSPHYIQFIKNVDEENRTKILLKMIAIQDIQGASVMLPLTGPHLPEAAMEDLIHNSDLLDMCLLSKTVNWVKVDHTLCLVASMHPIQVMNFCRRFPHMPVYAIAAEMSVLRSDEDMKYLLTRSTKENIQQTFQYLGCMDMHNEIEYVRHLTAQIEREVLMSRIPYPELSTDKKKI